MGAFDSKPVGLREISHRLVILLAGAKGGGELIRGQIVAKIGAGRLIKLLQEVGEFLAGCTMANRWPGPGAVALEPADGSEPFGYRRHMAALRPVVAAWRLQGGHQPARRRQRQRNESAA